MFLPAGKTIYLNDEEQTFVDIMHIILIVTC